jgi:ribosomal-protein-alanine N-acetyltransferase
MSGISAPSSKAVWTAGAALSTAAPSHVLRTLEPYALPTLAWPGADTRATPIGAPGRRGPLPVLAGAGVTLRPLRRSDAASLLARLSTEEVARFISPPPTTLEGFERFIDATGRQCAAGLSTCFGIVPKGIQNAVGLIQVRRRDAAFITAEWGFAIGSPFWGTGLFMDAATRVIDFAFGTVGVHRLEARAAAANGRGNGALRKLGAVQEAVLRESLSKDGQHMDQILWSILADDWCRAESRHGRRVR